MMKRIVGLISMALILSAFTQKSAYETAVKNMAPFYCYKSLAGVVIIGWPGFPQAHQERPGQHLWQKHHKPLMGKLDTRQATD